MLIIRGEVELRTKRELLDRAKRLLDHQDDLRREAAALRRAMKRSRGWAARLLKAEIQWCEREIEQLPVIADEFVQEARGLPLGPLRLVVTIPAT